MRAMHHPDVVHLDFVGHADVTARILDVDPEWSWEPVSVDEHGLPLLTPEGLLWIRLTILGVTRLGVGSCDNQGHLKTPRDAMKEVIGDAIRNAGMRFGSALDLWSKTDIRLFKKGAIDEQGNTPKKDQNTQVNKPASTGGNSEDQKPPVDTAYYKENLSGAKDLQELQDIFKVLYIDSSGDKNLRDEITNFYNREKLKLAAK